MPLRWRPSRLRRALRLMLVTDPALGGAQPLEQRVRDAVRGGVSAVQLRDKTASTRELVALARALLAALHGTGVPLIINDRLDVALAAGADGLHVGQDDLDVADARKWLPTHALLGLSAETVEHVQTATRRARSRRCRVDYLGLGPIFSTATKPDAAAPLGLHGLLAARAATSLPLVAIGGIHAANVSALRAAGADGIAVVSAIMAAEDAFAAARALRTPFDAEPSPG